MECSCLCAIKNNQYHHRRFPLVHRKTSKKNLFFEVLLWWHAWSHNCLQDFIILNTRYLWTRRTFSLFTKDFRGRLALDNKEAPTYLLFDHLTKCPNELLGLSFPQWKTARCLSFFDELTRLGLSHWLHCNALDHGWLKTPAPAVGRALPEDPGQAAREGAGSALACSSTTRGCPVSRAQN